MIEKLHDFVAALDAIDPELIQQIFQRIDLARTEECWQSRLEGNRDERAAVTLLINRAQGASGQIKGLADGLAQRFEI